MDLEVDDLAEVLALFLDVDRAGIKLVKEREFWSLRRLVVGLCDLSDNFLYFCESRLSQKVLSKVDETMILANCKVCSVSLQTSSKLKA